MKDARVYIARILEAIGQVEECTSGGEDVFQKDTKTQDAVIRKLEVIGEAAKRVPDSYREANPDVPWRRLAGLRDVLIHQYEGVDLLAGVADRGIRLAGAETIRLRN